MSYTAAVITVSDKGSRGERKDTSGPAICAMLEQAGWQVVHTAIVPDEPDEIRSELVRCTDEKKLHLVLTTGGTGFSPRDVTPEVTKSVIERETPGIPEVMRAESMKITPRGCLSRSVAGIRGRSMIVNLPGSEKAARENLACVLGAIGHGMDMLQSAGSADCAAPAEKKNHNDEVPSMDAMLKEAKRQPGAEECGMYLFHNGVVRATAKAQARQGEDKPAVTGMHFHYDVEAVRRAEQNTLEMPGIQYAKMWLNEGSLQVGDTIMLALVGGDIRPRVIEALQSFVGEVKQHCVTEEEVY